jgi:hypothetical protein
MRICPKCNKEYEDCIFTCPTCHIRLPRLNKPIVGHASVGDLDAYNEKIRISQEDISMIRDKNHASDSSDDSDDMDCAQPYNYVTHENGDRN